MSQLKVGFPLYEGFDSLDVIGPFQTFTFAGMDRYLLGPTSDAITSFEGVALKPRTTFDDPKLKLDILFVPGGADPVSVLKKGRLGNNCYLDFLARQAPHCMLVCSVCTGALLLAGAGLLDGHMATTHWAFKPVLSLFQCKVVDDYRRYIKSGNRVTGGGISSGLDEALYIVSLLYGSDQARQGSLPCNTIRSRCSIVATPPITTSATILKWSMIAFASSRSPRPWKRCESGSSVIRRTEPDRPADRTALVAVKKRSRIGRAAQGSACRLNCCHCGIP